MFHPSYLFSVYIEEAMQIIKWKAKRVKANGERETIIRFADDIAIVADFEKEINKMLHVLSDNLNNGNQNEKKTGAVTMR